MPLNTSQSIVDLLKSQGKPSDFNSRSSLYASSGLKDAFGDYRGTSEQNVTLLKKLSIPNVSATQSQGSNLPTVIEDGSGGYYFETPATDTTPRTRVRGYNVPPEYKDFYIREVDRLQGQSTATPKDVIADTTPSTIQNIYDLAKSDEEKAADAVKTEDSMALAGTAARASISLQRDVNTLNRTATEGLFDLATAGTKKKEAIGERAAGFGGAGSGVTRASQAEVAQEVAMKQDRVKAKLGDSLYNTFSDFEKSYGTEFLGKLSIPEAESFSKLPVAVRGIVMQNYQNAIEKANVTASKNALSTLEKLGYTVVGGQVVQTLAGKSAERADEAAIRAKQGLKLREEAGERGAAPVIKEFVTNGRRVRQLLDKSTGQVIEEIDLGDAGEAGGGTGTQLERERKEFGGFTRDQIQQGAASAGIPINNFNAFDEDSKNYFINSSKKVDEFKTAVSELKGDGNKLADEYKAVKNRSDLPVSVRDVLEKYIKNQLKDDKNKKKFQKKGGTL